MQVVANRIIGKSSEQIRAELNLADDFTEEERAQIKKENEWGREWRRMTLPFHFTLPFVQIYTLYNQNGVSGFLLNHFHSSGKLCFPDLVNRVLVNKFWVFFLSILFYVYIVCLSVGCVQGEMPSVDAKIYYSPGSDFPHIVQTCPALPFRFTTGHDLLSIGQLFIPDAAAETIVVTIHVT